MIVANAVAVLPTSTESNTGAQHLAAVGLGDTSAGCGCAGGDGAERWDPAHHRHIGLERFCGRDGMGGVCHRFSPLNSDSSARGQRQLEEWLARHALQRAYR
jgi:hypothetical protein